MTTTQDTAPIVLAKKFLCGAGAGCITKTSVAPMERIKILFQVQTLRPSADGIPKYRGIFQTAALIFKEEGFLGLWRGNGANCARVIPVYALKFGFNDSFKELVRRPGQKQLQFNQLILAGTTAGLFQVLITYPLDVIRTRMSLGPAFGVNYKSMVHCFQTSVAKEGLSSLYKGIGATIVSGAPYVGMQMTFYDVLKGQLPRKSDGGTTVAWSLAAGAMSGIVAQTLTYPGDVIRRRMQTNGIEGKAKQYTTTLDCCSQTWGKEGFRGFFHGYTTNLIRCVPGAAIQFAAFDGLKALLSLK